MQKITVSCGFDITWEFGHHEGVGAADDRGEDESEDEDDNLVHGECPEVLTLLSRPA